ncbi:MAG TPA: PrsW family intramembrane metalloprotease [Anaerolineaceae bacterium]|nr:PrsW family intramembrane metalloprotease [Anaerolineaceae bacterium]
MGFLVSVFFGFFPTFIFAIFIYWLDRYEKEPKILLGAVYCWGAIVAASMACAINTLFEGAFIAFTGAQSAADITTASIIAPIVEETLKGFAVFLVFLVFHDEFDSILDGIVYASIAALGFAATENTIYIYSGFHQNGWSGLALLVFVRVILVGWQHPFYTAFTGIGLAIARLNRNVSLKIIAPAIGLGTAISAHALHNILSALFTGPTGMVLTSALDWSGWLIMFGFILWMIRRERQINISQLKDEVTSGVITPHQYAIACSAWSQNAAGLKALFTGQYRMTSEFYQLCGDLAHKKQQFATLGEERENAEIIERTRLELKKLSLLIP